MDKSGNWSLIAGYLTHSLSPEEEQSLREWMASDPENQRKFEEARKIWKLAETRLPLPEIETEKEWKALLEKIESDAQGPTLEAPVRKLFTWQRIAAAFLVLAALFYIVRPSPDAPQLPLAVLPTDTISSDKFVVRHFLPDSTSVWLNISSKLIHLKEYNREIKIIGEAFFDVRKDSLPFIVKAGSTRTTVHGTIFNVLARREDSVVVNVTEGQVEFAPSDSTSKESVLLGANDRGTHSQAGLKKEAGLPFTDWRKENNPVYSSESKEPSSFLRNQYAVRKNVINETQIEGSITNTASLATYTGIRLKIVSTNARGKKTETLLDLQTHGPLSPGRKIDYKHTLFDVFSKKPDVTVKVERADIMP